MPHLDSLLMKLKKCILFSDVPKLTSNFFDLGHLKIKGIATFIILTFSGSHLILATLWHLSWQSWDIHHPTGNRCLLGFQSTHGAPGHYNWDTVGGRLETASIYSEFCTLELHRDKLCSLLHPPPPQTKNSHLQDLLMVF